MKNIFLMLFLLVVKTAHSQVLYVDPVTSAAMLTHSSTINGQLNTTNKNLTAIQRGQLAVTSQLVIVNDMQDRIYKGLSQVAGVINNLTTIKEITDIGIDIMDDVEKAINTAKSNPALLLFAEQGARDFQSRATVLATEVGGFVLKGGKDNLMDSGERAKLLNHIAGELRILRGIAYGMQRAMYWARMRGIWASLNPWATWQNMDVQIANSVITEAKYLKK
ncbi:hypothetical protein J7E50_02670 [Pedobacter sp. ISL-68]|uniref:hypothetical protein n=1 Tax=unclassified Pedobacter TaxID=2628915 RepID=UPI001BE56DC5|nr:MULTISPECIES: hypothetical protein [unclassified Pedobacter]MBT2560123.1 hypothetical protein [Pedobacter sp. ISL-64]MBT2589102.1 hypothetical protein [Pedobacter sp. ISL-68]